MTTQNRPDLHHSIDQIGNRRLASLLALQIRSVSASESFDVGRDAWGRDDQVNVDATDGAVVMSLPIGNDKIIGKVFSAVKTDSGGNAMSIARSGSDTIEGATSLSTTVQHARLAVYWDGSMYRRVASAAGLGAVAASSLAVSGNATVGGTLGVTGATTLGSTLAVTGAVSLTAGITVGTNAGITGNATVGGTLGVTGKATLAGGAAATLPEYADNAAALGGGLVAGDIYKTATGEVRITV